MDSPLNIRALAHDLGVSHTWLNQAFREVLGMPCGAYLRDLRLQEARQLLVNAGCSVADAAHAVGYGSPSHFARAYRERFGQSPSHTLVQTFTKSTMARS